MVKSDGISHMDQPDHPDNSQRRAHAREYPRFPSKLLNPFNKIRYNSLVTLFFRRQGAIK
jgi:hypothetical protein